MKKLFLLSLMLLVSLSFGCAREVDRTEAAREAPMTDGQLEQQVETRINSNPTLDAANISIDADAERNMVTLTGSVESAELKTQAVELARTAHPGVMVEDKLTVKPREISREEWTEEHARSERERAKEYSDKIGSTLDDSWIHAKIVAKLIGDTDVAARKINVDVNNNVVTLRGTVETMEDKTEAERIAKETDGVKRVVNQIKVQMAKAG